MVEKIILLYFLEILVLDNFLVLFYACKLNLNTTSILVLVFFLKKICEKNLF